MRHAHRKPGFTLIELLVVIAIITILIGLLIPAISIGQQRAERLKCQSNLHQIAIGAMTLFGELKESMPTRNPTNDYAAAAVTLMPYVKNVKEIFRCPASQGIFTTGGGTFQNGTLTTDYEFNPLLCNRRQSIMVDYSQVAYAYDYPYTGSDISHNDGINIGYVDGHAGWHALDAALSSSSFKTNGLRL